jgi:hypothetical protein
VSARSDGLDGSAAVPPRDATPGAAPPRLGITNIQDTQKWAKVIKLAGMKSE